MFCIGVASIENVACNEEGKWSVAPDIRRIVTAAQAMNTIAMSITISRNNRAVV
jgi:hypothetical protein